MFSCAFVTFPCGVLGQVMYLIVSIPNLCLLTYFNWKCISRVASQHAHSYFCLGVHVPPGVSIWGYMFIFEGTHILELFFHSKRIEAMKSDHLDVYNSDIIMLWKC